MLTKRFIISVGRSKRLTIAKITEIEIEIPSVTGCLTTAALNTKFTEIENKMSHITNWLQRLLLVQKSQAFKTRADFIVKYVDSSQEELGKLDNWLSFRSW